MNKQPSFKLLANIYGKFLWAPLATIVVSFTLLGFASHAANTATDNTCADLPELVKNVGKDDAKAKAKLGACYLSRGYKFLYEDPNGQISLEANVKAIEWYRKAAELGNTDADNMLYVIYSDAHAYAEAVKWIRKAAEQGDVRAEALLGESYMIGKGVTEDDRRGAVWIYKAAEQGDVGAKRLMGRPDIEFSLGVAYYLGKGVQQDYAQAAKWTRQAAEQGYAPAEFNLGNEYSSGQGGPQDYTQAVRWYRKAAAQGLAPAEHNLGISYANGRGVELNPAAAADWFYKAGIAEFKQGKRDEALLEAQLIKGLQNQYSGSLPNGFLANKLLAQIYGQPAASNLKPASQSMISEGTGWPVAGGFVVTNHHVIAGAQTIWIITVAGAKLQATIAADDVNNDLVLLKVQNPSTLPPALPIAPSPAAVGESVFALGYPHPDLMGSDVKLTDGIISAMAGPGDDPRLYQISAQVQSGNSGGPLLDMDGEVVGIVSAKLDAAKVFKLTGDLPENVNYAIKASYLAALLQSVNPIGKMPVLAGNHASLEALDKRIAPSVVMILAIPPESGNSSTAPQE